MIVTVLKEGSDIKSLFLSPITSSLEEDVEYLNASPLLGGNYTLEEKSVNKSLYDIIEFVGLNQW